MDTAGKFMSFTSYYLWFLIDTCGFVIDEVEDMYVFTKHNGFKEFVKDYMTKRQEAKFNGDSAGDFFYKICLNGSYGYDIMNEENFMKNKILNREKTFLQQLAPNFVSTKKLGVDTFQVEILPQSYRCDTSIIQGFFTLDNAKFWYLNFIYNFMYKCIDMTKVHFIEGDTDSMYWAVSGNPDEDNKQGFKYVIKDEKFYNENVYKWFPGNFYSSDNSNPTFKTKLEETQFEKKLLGLAIEKCCDDMIALAPKVYTCKNKDKYTNKGKGVVKSKLDNLRFDDYKDVLINENIISGESNNIQSYKGTMSKVSVLKNFLTASHTKYVVTADFSSYIPFTNKVGVFA
jgi:hypothetical protein